MYNSRKAYVFLSPFLILFTIFFLVPLLVAVILSFTDYSMLMGSLTNANFIGLENYQRAVTDELLWNAFKNTIIIALIAVPLQIVVPLILAVIINQGALKLKPLFKSGYYLPTVASSVAVAIMFMFLFQPNGIINNLFFFIPADLNWFDNPDYAKMPIALMHAWRKMGIFMLIYFAALQGIPSSYYEAAKMDGAGAIRRFRKITVPQIKGIIFFVSVMSVINVFKMYDEIAVTTEGGPLDSTTTVVYYIYELGFKNSDIGYAAAVSMFLLAFLLILTLIQRLIMGKEEKS